MVYDNWYSKNFLNLAFERILGFGESKVITYHYKYPFLNDIKNVFKQTEREDKELMKYYASDIKEDMKLMDKAKVLALAVNKRIRYKTDTKVYGRLEYWASPIEVHKKRYDDCDGYAVLLCYLLRLFGAQPWEVFVRAGDVKNYEGEIIGHAHVLVYNIEDNNYYPLEGSFYPNENIEKFGIVPIQDNNLYNEQDTWFITNDLISYSNYKLKFVR